MIGKWKCGGLCDESLIQSPVPHYDKIDDYIVVTQHCPICGKRMGYYIDCKSRRQVGFIVSSEHNV